MTEATGTMPKQKVGFLLGLGILFFPIVFVWALLKPGYSALARVVGFVWLGLGVLFTLSSIANSPSTSPSNTASTAVVDSAVSTSNPAKGEEAKQTPNQPSQPSKWTYDSDKDEMRGTVTKYANLESENEQKFGFPYDGGTATLTVRQRPTDGLNIILRIEGQFTCNSFNDDTVAVKFDDGAIQHYSCAEPSDGSTGVLFIRGQQRFLKNLKASSNVIVEAEFYQEGHRQMIFDTRGLEW